MPNDNAVTRLAIDVMKVMNPIERVTAVDMGGRRGDAHHTYTTTYTDRVINLEHKATQGCMLMWLISMCRSVKVMPNISSTRGPFIEVEVEAEWPEYDRPNKYSFIHAPVDLTTTMGTLLATAVVEVGAIMMARATKKVTSEEQAKQAMADIENANDPADMAAAIRRLINISVKQAVEEMKG